MKVAERFLMRPDEHEWHMIPVNGGTLHFPITGEWHTVGDRSVPSPIVLRLREPEEPVIELTIAVVDGVPRLVELFFARQGEGREVRKRDLALDLDTLIEQAVTIASARRGADGISRFPGAVPSVDFEQEIRAGIRAVQHARGRTQRPMTPDRMQQVATLYLAQESGGIEAVAAAYNVHRATAARWIAKAREAGIISHRATGEVRES